MKFLIKKIAQNFEVITCKLQVVINLIKNCLKKMFDFIWFKYCPK